MYIRRESHNTYIECSDEDVAFIKQARYQDKSHVEIIHDILDYFQEELDIVIEINSLPSNFDACGRKGAGWYGLISGRIMNADGTLHQSLHLNNIFQTWTSYIRDANYHHVCEVDTGSGSSGADFSLGGSCIKLSSFPTLAENIEHTVITEQTQKDFDRELNKITTEVQNTRKNYIETELRNNTKYKELQDAIDKCGDFLADLNKAQRTIVYNTTLDAEDAVTMVLPDVKNSWLDLTTYQKVLSKMKFKRSKEVPNFECIAEFENYIVKNTERFV